LNTTHYSESRERLDRYFDKTEQESEGKKQKMLAQEQEQHDRRKAKEEQAKEVERARKDTGVWKRWKESCVMM